MDKRTVFMSLGDRDCMDGTDEQMINNVDESKECPFRYDAFGCDEALFHNQYFSCGDGEFIDEEIRYDKLRQDYYCASFRDRNFLCEKDYHRDMWTMENGNCILYDDNFTIAPNTTRNKLCSLYTQCIFTDVCNCTDNCLDLVFDYCPDTGLQFGKVVKYPVRPILKPYLNTYIHAGKFDSSYALDITISHSIKCVGYQGMVLPRNSIIIARPELVKSNIYDIDSAFCNHRNIERNDTGPQYDKTCWTELSVNRSYRCRNSHRCISMYRLRDGVVDCPYEDDEDNKLNCSIFAMKNRFRCSETEQTCLLASALGNLKPDCRISEHDEHFSLLNVKLSDFRCKIPNSVECETVREYISYSQNISSPLILTAFMKNNQLSVPHNHGQISFHRYCDSFWDLDYGFDETPS
ncbi:unnamed protein product, partial [Didymodactylos carnosus]